MKRLRHERWWVGVTYFLILLSIALWVRDIRNQPDAFIITLQQISTGVTHMGDPTSFATAAIDIAETGGISSANEWIFNLWPPGFILMQALIIKVLGPETLVILVLQILAVILFSIVLTLLYDILNAHVKSKVVAMTLPLLIFAFPVSRVFLLQPKGITLGESFAIGSFLVCILLSFQSIKRPSISYAVLAGFCLALSAYFRSQFEFILLVLTGWGILLVITILLTRLRRSIEPNFLRSTIKTIVVVLLVAHAATMPWRLYRWTNFYKGTPSWVQSTSLVHRNSVMTTEYLESINGSWISEGTGNLVCRIDPNACGDTANAKKLFFRTFIRHPVEWYSLKFDAIGKYWFSSLRNWSDVKINPTLMDIVTNGILLITLISLVGLSFTRKIRSHFSWVLLTWFNISLFSAYVLIFSLVHFEVRYFYFPKITIMMMFIIVACLFCRRVNKKTSDSR